MKKTAIWIRLSRLAPGFEMRIPVPEGRDEEEYIDELLDEIINEDLRFNVEWDFCDGVM